MKVLTTAFFLLLLLPACTKHEIESRHQVEMAPVEVKPIHITIDVNIRVDRALDNFFNDVDRNAQELKKSGPGQETHPQGVER